MDSKDIRLLAVLLIQLISMQYVYPVVFGLSDGIKAKNGSTGGGRAKKLFSISNMMDIDADRTRTLKTILLSAKAQRYRDVTEELKEILETISQLDRDLNDDEQVTLLQEVLRKRFLLETK